MASPNDRSKYSHYSLKELYNVLSDDLSDPDRQEITNELSKRLEGVFSETLQDVYAKNNIGGKFRKNAHKETKAQIRKLAPETLKPSNLEQTGEALKKTREATVNIGRWIVVAIVLPIYIIAALGGVLASFEGSPWWLAAVPICYICHQILDFIGFWWRMQYGNWL
jgi:hypothetical protein